MSNQITAKMTRQSVDVYREDKFEEIPDSTKVTTPSLEYGDTEISGSGIIGKLRVPDPNEVGDLILTVTTTSQTVQQSTLTSPNGATVRITQAVSYYDKATGNLSYKTIVHICKGRCTKDPGADGEQGAAQEYTVELSCSYYKRIVNGEVQLEIDKLNDIFYHNGIDVLKELRTALG
ncbi:MAG: phage major tail tube protein [Selenomonadaceae bacterium]